MKIKRIDTTFSTEKLQESKEFYMNNFGFQLAYESDWYVELVTPKKDAGISFTLPQREEGEFFSGRGLILSFEVDHVESEYKRLQDNGVLIYQDLQDKPWGERSFVVDDPNGVHVYIYELIEQTDEYKALYAQFKA
ncbi:VOC family protein [Anaerosinus massiliensis]|uniref:VOC family protein n=1 Tax=Massilibacillus massiliensis TaxID=1806837 RepID=UPI000DA6265A|nr:VOC family protein [Massilibacillus massiliensis]